MKSIAIVTGASGGLGKEFVKLLIKYNDISQIWLIARNKEKLFSLKNKYGNKVRIFSIDLTDLCALQNLKEELDENIRIKYLINNAGFAKFCSFDELSINETLNMIDLNIKAVVSLGLLCVPFMEKGGHIINIASQAAFQPLPYMNVYSATKAFIRNYTRALNVELKDFGVNAIAVCPGWMKTGLYERGRICARKAPSNFCHMIMPDVVAKKALDDAKNNRDISVYGLYVKTAHFFSKILPQKIMMKIWLFQQKIK